MKIYNKLKELKQSGQYPFHMPGHKRMEKNQERFPYEIDITEIEGYDNLHHPEGIIKESMDELAKIYDTKSSYYLVNGSSCGLLAAIMATVKKGEIIAVGRNCHKAVYHAVRLAGAVPVYLYPKYMEIWDMNGAIPPEKIEKAFHENPQIKCVVITSPTYEGIVSDIKKIAQIVHAHNACLIVDEAHGAHFPFSDYFPKSAVKCNADLVIQSLHKTLKSPTQTALLHIGTKFPNQKKVEEYLSIFQTSSPSYVFLEAMEYAVEDAKKKKETWKTYEKLLEKYRTKWKNLKNIRLLDQTAITENIFDYDRGKLVFSVKNTNITGKQFFDVLLNKYNLQLEMTEKTYVIAMTSYCDTEEGFERLNQAVNEIDRQIEKIINKTQCSNPYIKNPIVLIPEDAAQYETESIKLEEALDRICGKSVYIYPPGSPILVPGEKILKETIVKIQEYIYNNMEVIGMEQGFVSVLKK